MSAGRGCGGADLGRFLGLRKVPAAQHFMLKTEPIHRAESANSPAMDLCIRRGFVQLRQDDTVTAKPRGVGAASTAGEGTAR